jgi:hypothetical protein
VSIAILRAISQHSNYLEMVRVSVADDGKNSHCCSCHDCAFGKWFYADGAAVVAAQKDPAVTSVYSKIADAHEKFHELSFKAVAAAASDKAASRALETEMMRTSSSMVGLLLEFDGLL